MLNRPSWNEVWISFSKLIAERSHHETYKVGAVIVTSDNTQVLSVGYNGNAAGLPNEVDSDVPGESGLIHAEINALIKLDYNNYKDKKMYLTLSPCSHCAKCIINAGIKEVYYLEDYRDDTGIKLLEASNVTVIKINL